MNACETSVVGGSPAGANPPSRGILRVALYLAGAVFLFIAACAFWVAYGMQQLSEERARRAAERHGESRDGGTRPSAPLVRPAGMSDEEFRRFQEYEAEHPGERPPWMSAAAFNTFQLRQMVADTKIREEESDREIEASRRRVHLTEVSAYQLEVLGAAGSIEEARSLFYEQFLRDGDGTINDLSMEEMLSDTFRSRFEDRIARESQSALEALRSPDWDHEPGMKRQTTGPPLPWDIISGCRSLPEDVLNDLKRRAVAGRGPWEKEGALLAMKNDLSDPVTEFLVQRLREDPERRMRLAAIESLGGNATLNPFRARWRGPAMVAALRDALKNDPDPTGTVQQQARMALLNVDRWAKARREPLEKEIETNTRWGLNFWAGPPNAEEQAKQRRLVQARIDEIKAYLATLPVLGEATQGTALSILTEPDKWLRQSAVTNLTLSNPEHRQVLLKLCRDDPAPEVRRMAMSQLGLQSGTKMDAESFETLLAALARDTDTEVRRAAANALIAPPDRARAESALRATASSDADPAVRAAARETLDSLRKLGDEEAEDARENREREERAREAEDPAAPSAPK